MTIAWQNAVWLQRLFNLARPNESELNSTGVLLSTQVVNDARWLSSRENNPAGIYGFQVSTPAVGNHSVLAMEAIDANVIRTLLVHWLRVNVDTGVITMAFVVDPANTLTWAVGPNPRPADGGDPLVDGAIQVWEGNIATANLPANRFTFINDPDTATDRTVTVENWGPVPQLFTRDQAIVVVAETSTALMRLQATLQGVRD